jgi:hypothetical protein
LCVCHSGQKPGAFCLLERHSPSLAPPPPIFVLVIFEIASHVYAQASLDHDPVIYASFIAGMVIMPPFPAFIGGDGGLVNFLSVLTLKHHPPSLYLLSS